MDEKANECLDGWLFLSLFVLGPVVGVSSSTLPDPSHLTKEAESNTAIRTKVSQ